MAITWMSHPQVRKVSREVASEVERTLAERLAKLAEPVGGSEDSLSDPERVRGAMRLSTKKELAAAKVAEFLGLEVQSVNVAMHRLVKSGEVLRVDKGVYALKR